jgi:hypothetical protein
MGRKVMATVKVRVRLMERPLMMMMRRKKEQQVILCEKMESMGDVTDVGVQKEETEVFMHA